ncbi:hypothetical protein CCMA1212_002334 [Trichoderma ghanense]|uniref:Uncharacterized protein n=1 Tax=Trichoderma ghanense TaxID=65468 RepID=A0ABY2HDA2_9HYPO
MPHIKRMRKAPLQVPEGACTGTAAAMQGTSIRGPTANGSGCHEALNKSLRPSIRRQMHTARYMYTSGCFQRAFCFVTGHLGCSFDRLSAVSSGFNSCSPALS